MDYSKAKIFTPIKIGGFTMRNRVLMAPMTLSLEAYDGSIAPELVEHYKERGKGGVGAIELDCLTVDYGYLYRGPTSSIDDDDYLPGLKKVCEELHETGVALFPQVTHPGPESACGYFGIPPIGPSSYMNDNDHIVREMTEDEIWQCIKQYGSAAKRAVEAGFDGMQFHCGHAYMLPGSFLSPLRNFRMDEWGGCIDNRARFAIECIKEIRRNVPKDWPIIMRISGSERYPGGNTIEDMCYIVPKIVAAGVDAIEVSGGTQYELSENIIPCHGMPRGSNIAEAKALKEILDIPVFVVGKIENLQFGADLVERGVVDGVTLGRPLLADPEIVNKTQENRLEDIAPCASCGGGCIMRTAEDVIAKCNINPRMCREVKYPMEQTKAEKSKKVLIIGGGPGGLMAAKTAAERGHVVTLWEKSERWGGQVNYACRAPGKQDDVKWIQYLLTQCKKNGVTLELGKEATVENIKEFAPEAVIVATGAKPIIPTSIPGVDPEKVVTAQDFLDGKVAIPSGRVCILGGGIVATETAEVVNQYHRWYLHDDTEITLVEMKTGFAQALNSNNKAPMTKRLRADGTKFLARTKVVEIMGNKIKVENEDGEQSVIGAFDHILFALGTKSYDPISEAIKEFVPEVKVVGDAKQARLVVWATREGYDAAMEL